MAIKAFRVLLILLLKLISVLPTQRKYSAEEKNYLLMSMLWQLPCYWTSSASSCLSSRAAEFLQWSNCTGMLTPWHSCHSQLSKKLLNMGSWCQKADQHRNKTKRTENCLYWINVKTKLRVHRQSQLRNTGQPLCRHFRNCFLMKNISHTFHKEPLLICSHKWTHSGDELQLGSRRDSWR